MCNCFQIIDVLEDQNYNIDTNNYQIHQTFNILELLVTISDSTITSNITDIILNSLTYQVSLITVFQPSCEFNDCVYGSGCMYGQKNPPCRTVGISICTFIGRNIHFHNEKLLKTVVNSRC